jgi:hypothetical protein
METMTKEKFALLTNEKKAKACKLDSFQRLLVKASEEQARFKSCNFDIYTAMYRVYRKAIAKPKKVKQPKPLYQPVTTNMLVRAMYDTYIPRDEKLC